MCVEWVFIVITHGLQGIQLECVFSGVVIGLQKKSDKVYGNSYDFCNVHGVSPHKEEISLASRAFMHGKDIGIYL